MYSSINHVIVCFGVSDWNMSDNDTSVFFFISYRVERRQTHQAFPQRAALTSSLAVSRYRNHHRFAFALNSMSPSALLLFFSIQHFYCQLHYHFVLPIKKTSQFQNFCSRMMIDSHLIFSFKLYYPCLSNVDYFLHFQSLSWKVWVRTQCSNTKNKELGI